MEDFTLRNVTKYAVKAAVHGYVASVAADAITDYTRFEEDDAVVRISSNVIGWGVSDKLKPVTNKIVDKTADFIVAKREARKSKKNNTKKDEK